MGRKALYFSEGIIVLGANRMPNPVSVEINEELIGAEHKRGNGATVSIPAGKNITGTIGFNELTPEFLAAITGATSATGSWGVVREGEETHTIGTNTITLTQAGDVVQNSICLKGSAGTIFKLVTSAPAVGQYSYASATGICTFNASETDTVISPSYLHAETTGTTLSMGTSLPSSFKFYGNLRTEDMDISDSKGDIVIMLEKVVRKGSLVYGGEVGGNTSAMQFEFTAIISVNTDFQIAFTA